MSKVRIPINPMQVGRVGAYSMYVRSGEQIVRQRKNSSNYGAEASRTESQMIRRVKWSSLVNFYKVCSAWMPKAYETLKTGQTVYNKFMQLNINKAHCALTKDMAANGCCCIENWTISQGSLSPIELDPPIGTYGVRTDIELSSAINASTTVKSLSEDIIANNSTFQNGDNIAMVWFKNYFDSREYPFAVCEYFEFTLDTSNTALLSTTDAGAVIASGNLTNKTVLTTKESAVEENGANAFVFIHTRKVGGQLKVSTQDVYVSTDDYTDPFTGPQAVQDAIDSYGVDQEVPLDPSFSKATIKKVLFNGSVIWDSSTDEWNFRFTANEGGELEFQGTGFNAETLVLNAFDGQQSTVYTPLEVTETSWKYILSSNGSYTPVVNKYILGVVKLTGIEIPAELTGRIGGVQVSTDVLEGGDTINSMSTESGCLQFAHPYNEDYPYFRFGIRFVDGFTADLTDFELVNATIAQDYTTPTLVRLSVQVSEISSAAYISYKGIIIAVFNYS